MDCPSVCSCKHFILENVAASGSLISKIHGMTYKLLEVMAANAYHWPFEYTMPKKSVGVHKVDALFALTAEVATLSKHIGAITILRFILLVKSSATDLILVLNVKLEIFLLHVF